MYITIYKRVIKVGSSLGLAVEAFAGATTDTGRQGRNMVTDNR